MHNKPAKYTPLAASTINDQLVETLGIGKYVALRLRNGSIGFGFVAHRQSLNLRNGIELTLFRKIDGHLWTRKEVFYLDEIVGITNTKHTSYDSAVREWPNRHLANGLWIVAE